MASPRVETGQGMQTSQESVFLESEFPGPNEASVQFAISEGKIDQSPCWIPCRDALLEGWER